MLAPPDVRHLAGPPARVRPMYIAGQAQAQGPPCHQQVAAASTLPGRRWEGASQPGSGRNSAHQAYPLPAEYAQPAQSSQLAPCCGAANCGGAPAGVQGTPWGPGGPGTSSSPTGGGVGGGPPRASSAALLHTGGVQLQAMPPPQQIQVNLPAGRGAAGEWQEMPQAAAAQVPAGCSVTAEAAFYPARAALPEESRDSNLAVVGIGYAPGPGHRSSSATAPGPRPAAASQPQMCHSPPKPMTDGDVVTIGQTQFVVGGVLGEGAYARVWAAEGPAQEDVAIKEMRCGQGPGILPDATLQRAVFEVSAMQKLTDGQEELACPTIYAPRVIDHQFWPLGPATPGAYLCRVAMSRRAGVPLVDWLERRTRRSRAVAPRSGVDSDEVGRYCRSFFDAVMVARTMLVQLCPTFEKLNLGIAYHRDVNARNLLIYSPTDGDPNEQAIGAAPPDSSLLQCSIVDFGNSTDARAWIGPPGEGSWQVENPTGDARYWGPASWLRFLGGAQAVLSDAGLTRQYARRLDIFAMAICALEIIGKLHNVECPPELTLRSLARMRGAEVRLVHCVQRLRNSWSAYWTMAVRSFDRLAEYSRLVCCGDPNGAAQIWQELSAGVIPQSLAQKLRDLCKDLRTVEEMCQLQSTEAPSYAPVRPVGLWEQAGDALGVLCDMATEGSPTEWVEFIKRLTCPDRRRRISDGLRMAPGPGGCSVACAAPTGRSYHDTMDSDVMSLTQGIMRMKADAASSRGGAGAGGSISIGAKSPPVTDSNRQHASGLSPNLVPQPQPRSPEGEHQQMALNESGCAGQAPMRGSRSSVGGSMTPRSSGAEEMLGRARPSTGPTGNPAARAIAKLEGLGKELADAREAMNAVQACPNNGNLGPVPANQNRRSQARPQGAPAPADSRPSGQIRQPSETAATNRVVPLQLTRGVLQPDGFGPGSPPQSPLLSERRTAATASEELRRPGLSVIAMDADRLPRDSFTTTTGSLKENHAPIPLGPQINAGSIRAGMASPGRSMQTFPQQPDGTAWKPASVPTPSPSGSTNGDTGCMSSPHGGSSTSTEAREHEALRILRQVESEVRTLKRWYTEAIEAMRSPPYPAMAVHGMQHRDLDTSVGQAPQRAMAPNPSPLHVPPPADCP